MSFEIIDFHTHPFIEDYNNICAHKDFCDMGVSNSREVLSSLGISKICGSVVGNSPDDDKGSWEAVRKNNEAALELRHFYKDFYIPGFHIHPDYIDESVNEIKNMHKKGVKLIGELVPYMNGWSDYSAESFSVLLDEAGKHNMIVSFHSQGEDEMDKMAENHKDVLFVAAHPGEYTSFMRHLERMKKNENYYLDLSGYGLFRYGMLRRAIDTVGADRILFGSDFPTCNTGMYIGGILFDPLITDNEKEKIFCLNAKKILNIVH